MKYTDKVQCINLNTKQIKYFNKDNIPAGFVVKKGSGISKSKTSNASLLRERKQAKMNNDPYDTLPLGMVDEEFFEEIALEPREPTDDELCNMFNLSAQEHPEMFLPREISSLEALSTYIAESSMYTNSKPCDIIDIDEKKKE